MGLIVLIEDDPAQIDLIANSLRTLHCDIEVATDGETGMEMAYHLQPDVVILDLGLPGGVSGVNVIEALKGHDETHHIPIVVLTARSFSSSRIEAEEAGCDAFFTKPYNVREFRNFIGQFVPS